MLRDTSSIIDINVNKFKIGFKAPIHVLIQLETKPPKIAYFFNVCIINYVLKTRCLITALVVKQIRQWNLSLIILISLKYTFRFNVEIIITIRFLFVYLRKASELFHCRSGNSNWNVFKQQISVFLAVFFFSCLFTKFKPTRWNCDWISKKIVIL